MQLSKGPSSALRGDLLKNYEDRRVRTACRYRFDQHSMCIMACAWYGTISQAPKFRHPPKRVFDAHNVVHSPGLARFED